MKNIYFLLCLFLFLNGSVSAQQHSDRVFDPDFFPFSVWYSGGDARAPMLSEVTGSSREEWLKDLEMIKELGFNTVRTWIEWQKAEPRPGAYNFENLELLLELADEVGLKVFIQMYADSAPEWVGKQHPTAKFQTQSGVMIESQSAPGYCPDHTGVRKAMLSFYTETAKIASAYDNFYGWDLWSEPHIINWAHIDYVQNAQFCYCPYTQHRFRDWLRDKYQTLGRLNRAWHREFIEWNDVSPPRFSTILSYTDYLDWKTFIYEKLAEDLRMRYDAVREGDPDHVITSHAAVSSIIVSPHMGVGATDDFLMADVVDYYGVSLYPKHNHPDRHWPAWRVMNMMDFSRSANRKNRGWYVGELQAGIEKPVKTDMDGSLPEPVSVRLHENTNGYLLYAINHGTEDQSVEITVQTNQNGSHSIRNILDDTIFTVQAADGELIWEKDLKGRDAAVWSIQAK